MFSSTRRSRLIAILATFLFAACLFAGSRAYAQTPATADTTAAGTTPSTTADTPSATLFNQAMQSLRLGQLDSARTDLQTIIERSEKDTTAYMAQVLLLQINGSFAQRQQHWLKRRQIDTLVLVPDERSFYAALNYWTDTTYFPVLIDDGWLAPAFARAYNPKQIIRFTAPPDAPPSNLTTLIEAHNKSFITFEPNTAAPTAFLPPPGLVVIDPASPLAPAYALAKARHQPILSFHPDINPNQTVNAKQLNDLNEPIMQAAAKFGLLSPAQWSAVTLAVNIPYRYNIDNQKGDFAVDDALGREAHGLRLAVFGRLVGNPSQSIYQAMGSLFLQPANALLFDDYSNRSGPFVAYRQDTAQHLLASHMPVTLVSGEDVNVANFRKLTRIGSGFDMIWLNSSGGSNYFDFKNSKGLTDDFPLGHACSIHAIHSWSAQNPTSTDTLAGRALAGGCYWYFGSLHEPYLNAFVDPTLMAERALSNTPLAFAARQLLPNSFMYRPWKLVVLGDPLFVLRDKPADRTTSISSLPPDFTNLQVTQQITPENFRIASMLRPDIADALAPRLLTQPQNLQPSDLASAMWFADLAGHTQLVADVPVDLASKHLIAKALLLRDADAQAHILFAGDNPASSEQYVALVLQITPRREHCEQIIKSYLAAMAKHNQGDSAVRFLTTLKDATTSPLAKDALTKALTPPAPPPAPAPTTPSK